MSTTAEPRAAKRVLDPFDRVSEVLFGLIMVLTFTGSLSVAEAGREDIRTMLIGALGCNLVWGVIDAVFYLLGCLAEKHRSLVAFLAVRSADTVSEAGPHLAALLPPRVSEQIRPGDLDPLIRRLRDLPPPPRRARLRSEDWQGALGVFLLVFFTTLPVGLPFAVMSETRTALRLSNGIAMAMLFVAGWVFGRITGRSPALAGLFMVVLGGALVGLTMALGG